MCCFLSVIISTKNSSSSIKYLLESLINQKDQDFQCIIQDCLSQDNTLKIISEFNLPNLVINSYNDNGIYDAWNKALEHAAGDWILFLGSDDRLIADDAIAKIRKIAEKTEENIMFISFPVAVADKNNDISEIIYPAENCFARLAYECCLPFPGLLIRKKLFENEKFNACLQIAGDYELLARCLKKDNFVIGSQVLVCMKIGGISSDICSLFSSELELLQISKKHFPNVLRKLLYMRLARSLLLKLCSKYISLNAGCMLADYCRISKGKAGLWTTPEWEDGPHFNIAANPCFSLLIATLGRTKEIEKLLESLARQTWKNFEIIIADQNCEPVIEPVIARYKKYLTINHINFKRGNLSTIRNKLVELSKGDFILFPDDDCIFLPDCLERLAKMFAKYPGYFGIVFKWSNKKEIQCEEICVKPVRSRHSLFWRSSSFTQCYRRAAFKKISFDPAFGPAPGRLFGSGEDSDLALTAFGKGLRLGYAPDVLALHPLPNPSKQELRKYMFYGIWRMRLLKKHGFSLWFSFANIIYPLLKICVEKRNNWQYRLAMFKGRYIGFFRKTLHKKTKSRNFD